MKTPTTQQIEDAAFLTRTKYACLFSEPGTGKTLTAITARKALPADLKTLIIAPKIALRQWQKELGEQGIEAAVYRAGKDFRLLGTMDVIITTWALMATNTEALEAWGPVVIIADESHACIDYKSNRTGAFFGKVGGLRAAPTPGLATVAEWCWLLTGTPVVRFADDLWPMLRSMFPGALGSLVGTTKRAAFCEKFVVYKQVNVGGGKFVSSPLRGQNEDLLNAEIYGANRIAVRRTLKEVDADLPTMRERDVEVEINAADRAALKAMTKGMSMRDLMKDSEEVKSIRRAFGRAKVAGAVEYLRETADQGPVLILTWHQDVTDALLYAFSTTAVVIDGRTSEGDRQRALANFKDGIAPVMIGQIGAVGTALDGLQHACRRVVFVERIGSPALMGQAIARVQRRGQREVVQVEYIRADHELEVVTDMTLEAKTDTQTRAIG